MHKRPILYITIITLAAFITGIRPGLAVAVSSQEIPSYSILLEFDKDLYYTGETAYFDVRLFNGQEPVALGSLEVEAVLLQEEKALPLKEYKGGRGTFSCILEANEENPAIEATVYRKNRQERTRALLARKAKFLKDIERLRDSRWFLFWKREKIEREIDQLGKTVEKIESSVEQLNAPLAKASKSVVVLSRPAILLNAADEENIKETEMVVIPLDDADSPPDTSESFSPAPPGSHDFAEDPLEKTAEIVPEKPRTSGPPEVVKKLFQAGAVSTPPAAYTPSFYSRVRDTIPPVTSSDYKKSGIVTNEDVRITLQAADNAKGVEKTFYRINGGSWKGYDRPITDFANGEHVVEYYSIDKDGNKEDPPHSVTVRIDRTPPALTVSYPSSTQENTIAMNGTVSEDTGVLTMDGHQVLLKGGTFSIAHVSLPVRKNVFRFEAIDQAGNKTVRDVAIECLWDKTAPAIAIKGIERGVFYPKAVTPVVTVDDAQSKVTMSMVLNGETFLSGMPISKDGEYTLSVEAVDAYENHAGISVSFSVDRTAPETKDDYRKTDAWSHDDAKIVLLAADTGAGVESIYYRIGGGVFAAYQSPIEIQEEGIHRIQYYAQDRLGNKESFKTTMVKIDKTPPAIGLKAEELTVEAADILTPVNFSSPDVKDNLDNAVRLSSEHLSKQGYPLGTTHVLYQAVDHAGNSSSAVTNVRIQDSTAPRISLDFPRDNSYAAHTVNVSGRCEEIFLKHLLINGEKVDVVDGQFARTIPVAGDKFEVEVKAADTSGNEGAVSRTVLRDILPPETGHDYAHDGVWTRENARITLSALDAGSGIQAAYYRIYAEGTTPPAFILYNPGNAIAIDQEGRWIVEYYSVDQVGGAESPHLISVLLDKTAPVMADDYGGQINPTNQDVVIVLTATDAHSGAAAIYARLDQADFASVTGPITVSQDGKHVLEYYALDKAGNEEVHKTLDIPIDKTPPQIVVDSPADGGTIEENTVVIKGAVSGDTVALTLNGQSVPLLNSTFLVNNFKLTPGENKIALQAEDGAGNQTTLQLVVTKINRPPALNPVADITVSEGQAVNFHPTGSDLDGDSVTFSYSGWMTSASYTTTYDDAGAHMVTVTASDGDLTVSQDVSVTVNNVNRPPVLDPVADVFVNEGETVNLNPAAGDSDGDSVTFSYSGWMTSSSHVTTYDDAGQHTVTVTVSDGNLTDSQDLTVIVGNVNRLPVADAQKISLDEDTPSAVVLTGSDPDQNTIAYALVSAPVHGVLSGGAPQIVYTPNKDYNGTDAFSFKVNDGSVDSIAATVDLLAHPVNDAPVLGLIGNKSVDENGHLEFTVTATDVEGDILTIAATPLKSWMSFNGTTFSADPGFGDSGNHAVTFTVSDGTLTDTEAVIISVGDVNRPPQLALIGDRGADEGGSLQFVLSAGDPDGDTLHFTASNLPAGSNFNADTRTFAWQPDYDQAGVFSGVHFEADDGEFSDVEDITITVNNVNRAPALNPVANLTIDEGQTVVLNPVAVDPDGDSIDFTYSGWMNSTERVTGYEDAGVYAVTITASDGQLTDSQDVTVTVKNVNRAPVLDFIFDLAVYEGATVTFNPAATDSDGDMLTFGYSGWMSSASYTVKRDDSGSHTVTVSVSDGQDTDSQDVTVTVEACGDGIKNGPEICDEGTNNGTPNHCNAQCAGITAGVCGNNIKESGEACDDGNKVSGDGCSTSCVKEYCGDNIVQTGLGETCEGNSIRSCVVGGYAGVQSCTNCIDSGCVPGESCGDGTIQTAAGESCDDGNITSEDGCSAACKLESCGDGIVQSGLGEQCDDGNALAGDGCNAGCQNEYCGDGIIQTDSGEVCDSNARACTTSAGYSGMQNCGIQCIGFNACTTNLFCGDGVCSNPPETTTSCPSDCPAICGNGIAEPSEQCDDGNTLSGDGCSENCALEYCGDGIVQTVLGEECDDGNTISGDGCSATCIAEDITAPSVPTGLAATAISSSQINLSWTDNVGIVGYKIFRDGTQITTTANTTYQDAGLSSSTTYSYTVSAYDAAGNNSSESTSVSATTQTIPPISSYQPPIGIPAPPFGIDETAPSRPAGWPSTQVAGYYYIDNTYPGAIDSGNTYGYPEKPRLTIPNPIPAGSVVEVHGVFNSNITINSQGTVNSPVFVRGRTYEEKPVFGLILTLNGSYLIVENIKTEPKDANVSSGNSGIRVREGAHHIAVRNAEISGVGNLNKTGTIGIGSWGYTGTSVAEYIVLYNLDEHDMGDLSTTLDQDAHGVAINGNAAYVWILNSRFTRNSGDAVQIEAQHTRGRDKIHHIYIGNNVASNMKQTGFWIKHAQDVIMSQNEVYGMSRSPSSGGGCVGYQYSGDYFWFLYNKLHDCYGGITAQSGDSGEQTEVYYIGNVIYNINSDQPTNPHESGAIKIRMAGAKHYIINNTIHDADSGIVAPIAAGQLEIFNNIISSRNEPAGWDIYAEGAALNSTARYNQFYKNDGLRFYWGSTVYNGLSSFESAGGGTNNKEGDPLFSNIGINDFQIGAFSPAVDAGALHTAYATFFNRYNIDISKDFQAISRPRGSAWDIGAFEYVPGTAVCGNNIKETGEGCDDGNTIFGDGCSATCVVEFCGDGIVQPDLGETCEGNSVRSCVASGYNGVQSCTADCTYEACVLSEYCGDGAIQTVAGEACDDGNMTNGDGCNATCLQEQLADATAPSVPTGLTATVVSSIQINLSWTASTDNVGVTGYRIFRNGAQVGTSTTATTYVDTGLTASTAYTYTVSAYDAAGNESAESLSASATTQAAISPTGNVYYVSPTGAATWANCGGSTPLNGTAACSWQTAMANAVAGDIVYFRGGTYDLGTFDNDAYSLVGNTRMYPANSGTAENPIIFIAYPGEIPNITGTVTANSQEAWFGCGQRNYEQIQLNKNYITWDGFSATMKVNNGSTSFETALFRVAGDYCTIRNSNFTGVDVGNWAQNTAFVRIEGATNGLIENNYFHDLTSTSYNAVNTAAVYFNALSNLTTVRNNTVENCEGGIYGKGNSANVSIYNNFIYNSANNGLYGVWYKRSNSGGEASTTRRVYQNVIVGYNPGIWFENGGVAVAGSLIYNNALYASNGTNDGLEIDTNHTNTQIFNNIISNTNPALRYLDGTVSYSNYNDFYNAAGNAWSINWSTTYTDISSWQIATNFDLNSLTSNPNFINPGGSTPQDYKRISYSQDGRGGIYPNVMGAYVTGDEIIGYVAPQVPDAASPSVPTGLTATAVSSSRIDLSWAASTDDVGVTGYRIYRAGVQIATATATTYSDAGLIASTAYTYTVAAYDAVGNISSQSSSAGATTQSLTTAPSVENLDEMFNRKARRLVNTFPNSQLEDSANNYIWQPETFMYRDVTTGKEVWKLTNTPNLTSYYHNDIGLPVWSADGKRTAFSSVGRITQAYSLTQQQEWQSKWMVLNTNGSFMRPAVEAARRIGGGYFEWSPQIPEVFYEIGETHLGTGAQTNILYKSILNNSNIIARSSLITGISGIINGMLSSDGRKVIVENSSAYYPATVYPDSSAGLNDNGYSMDRNFGLYGNMPITAITNYHGQALMGDGLWFYAMPSGSSVWWRMKTLGSGVDGGPLYTGNNGSNNFGEVWPENHGSGSGLSSPFVQVNPYISTKTCYWSHFTPDRWGRRALFSSTCDGLPNGYGPGTWDIQNHQWNVPSYGGSSQHHDWHGFTDYVVSSRGAGSDPNYLNDRIYIAKYNDPASQQTIAYTHTLYNSGGIYGGAGVQYASLTRPAQSPDGTKVAFHSTFLNASDYNPDIYWVVAYNPYPPTDLEVAQNNGVRLSWLPPKYTDRNWPYASSNPSKDSLGWPLLDAQGNEIGEPLYAREIKKYHIWKSSSQTGPWQEVGSTNADYSSTYAEDSNMFMLHPVAGGLKVSSTNKISFTDNPSDGTFYYAITSEEHSGLESDKLSEIIRVTKSGSNVSSQIVAPQGQDNFWRGLPQAPAAFSYTVQTTAGHYGLNWTEPDDSKIRYYNIYYSTSGNPQAIQQQRIASVPIGTSTYLDWLADQTNVGYYGITAVDRHGNESAIMYQGAQQQDTTPPSVPANLTVTAVSSSQINLSWIASTDNVGVAGYRIFRNGIQVAMSTASSYSNTGLSANTNYAFTVLAYDAAGNESAESTSASAATQATTSSASNVYYVSPTGTATWANCGGATPLNETAACSWQTAMANAVAGDTVYFRGGDYDPGAGPQFVPAMNPAHSGINGNPIVFMSYPGESATIHEASGTGISGTQATIGGYGRSYIIWDGFSLIRDKDTGYGASAIVVFDMCDNCIIRNSDIRGVTPHMDHTNGVLIMVLNSRYVSIYNNKLHGMVGASNPIETPVNTGAMWIFDYDHIYIYNNDIYDVRNGVQMKDQPNYVYIYKNHFWNCSGVAINAIHQNLVSNTDVIIYQNIMRDCKTALYSPDPSTPLLNNLKFYNNTIYNSDTGTMAVLGTPSYQPHRNAEIFNNIISNNGSGNPLLIRYHNSLTQEEMPSYADYNDYHGNGYWNLNYNSAMNYSTLSAWRVASGLDNNSIVSNPLFVNTGGSNPEDYKLQSTSPARIGRGGSYASVMGAYITGNELIGYQAPGP